MELRPTTENVKYRENIKKQTSSKEHKAVAFITAIKDTQLSLNQDILPNPEDDFGVANYDLLRRQEKLRQAQHVYRKELKIRSAQQHSLELKTTDLQFCNSVFLGRQFTLDTQESEELNKFDIFQTKINENLEKVSSLIDTRQGAMALLIKLQQRVITYRVYGQFIQNVCNKLALNHYSAQMENLPYVQQQQHVFKQSIEQLNKLFSMYKKNRQSQTLYFDQDQELQQRYDELQKEYSCKQLIYDQKINKLEQRLSDLQKQRDKLIISRGETKQEAQNASLKCSIKMQDSSNILVGIDSLYLDACNQNYNIIEKAIGIYKLNTTGQCNGVIATTQDEMNQLKLRWADEFLHKQKIILQKYDFDTLLGQSSEKLENQVSNYFEKIGKIVPRQECYLRILGLPVVQRIYHIFKFSQLVRDAQDLIKIMDRRLAESKSGKLKKIY